MGGGVGGSESETAIGQVLEVPRQEIRVVCTRVGASRWRGVPGTGSTREAEKTGLADGVNRNDEKKTRLKDDSEVFGLSNWVNSGAIH